MAGTVKVQDVNVQRIDPLPSPKEFQQRLPITPAIAQRVSGGREEIARILRGEDQRFLVFAGPCSIHDTRAGMEYAQRIHELAGQMKDRMLIVMRVYFEKPRTTVGWKGLVYDPHLNGSFDIPTGLHTAREFLLRLGRMGVLAATEFVDPITPQYIADLVSWGAIGARTSESQTHREMASGLSMPVGFKNGTGGSIQLAVDGVVTAQAVHGFLGVDQDGRAAIVVTKGNPNCHIVLRGGSPGPNYHATAVADAIKRLNAAGVSPQVVIDCSHANCNRDYKLQAVAFRDVLKQRIEGGNKSIVGAMLESHLFAGKQTLNEKDPSALKYGVSITDPCIDWDETVSLLSEAYAALGVPQRTAATVN
ncbi:MAG: 3-deoxy-7-phosphoheptulonate synthase [Chloroflexi bacterium]|nr:3-deoxy-7-phosphoheptulonate synthase [Chloroflexota bacterium]